VALQGIRNLAHPGENVTGLRTYPNEPGFVGKRLELLKEAMPTLSRVGPGLPRSPTAPPGSRYDLQLTMFYTTSDETLADERDRIRLGAYALATGSGRRTRCTETPTG